MRIALIGHHVAPIRPPFAGGVESLTWYLARWLARRGHEVTLFAPPGSEVPGVEVRELALAVEPSAASRADVAMPPAAFMSAHHAYQEVLVELAEGPGRYDLVHSHSLHYLPVAMAELVPTTVLLTLHTPPTPWLESALAASRDPGLRLTAVSAAVARLWREAAGPVAAVIPNGIDLGDWAPGRGGGGAVWCGRMVPEKAPHLAIEAARAAGVPLSLAGPIVDAAYWEREVAPRLDGEMRYVGHLNHRALAELVGAGRVAVATPVWEEPFGLVAAEAIAAGTPVAAFARGGLPDFIGAEAGRLARPDDVADLAAAIRAAAELPRERVRAYAEARLGIDAMGCAYEELYERVVERPAGLRRASGPRRLARRPVERDADAEAAGR
jgi:glycosyltransferase involved in cell wall biosynthesis